MKIFDLLFIVCFLAAVVSLILAIYYAVRRQFKRCAHVFRLLAYGAALYASLLVAVSLTSRPTILKLGEKQCFDDWCVSVQRAENQTHTGQPPTIAQARGVFVLVTVRVSNRGRGRTQSARDAQVSLIDSKGARYYPSQEGQKALDAMGTGGQDLTTKIPAGEWFERIVVFDVPKDAKDFGLIVSHGRIPGVLIIGDPTSLLHAPTKLEIGISGGS